jgi:uncharacterized membrane protein
MAETQKKHMLKDRDMQLIMGNLLRVGVVLSMTVVFIGGVIYLMGYGQLKADYSEFVLDEAGFFSLASIWTGILEMNGKAIIQLGILLLIFTPISRVILAVFSFFLERDYLYVFIGLMILGIILFSLSNKLAG